MQHDHNQDQPQQQIPLQRAQLQLISLRDLGSGPSFYTGCTGSACCSCFNDDNEE